MAESLKTKQKFSDVSALVYLPLKVTKERTFEKVLPRRTGVSNTLATHWQHIGNTLATLLRRWCLKGYSQESPLLLFHPHPPAPLILNLSQIKFWYIHTDTHIYKLIYIQIHIYRCIYTDTYIQIHIYIYACIYTDTGYSQERPLLLFRPHPPAPLSPIPSCSSHTAPNWWQTWSSHFQIELVLGIIIITYLSKDVLFDILFDNKGA